MAIAFDLNGPASQFDANTALTEQPGARERTAQFLRSLFTAKPKQRLQKKEMAPLPRREKSSLSTRTYSTSIRCWPVCDRTSSRSCSPRLRGDCTNRDCTQRPRRSSRYPHHCPRSAARCASARVLSRETLHDHARTWPRSAARSGVTSAEPVELRDRQGKRGAPSSTRARPGACCGHSAARLGRARRPVELDSGFAQAPLTLEGMAAYAGVMQTHLEAFSLTAITDDVGPYDFITNDHTLILHGTLDYKGADGTNQTTSFKIYLSGGEFGATPTYVGTFSFPPGTLPGDPSTTTTVDWSVNLQTLGVSAAQYLNDAPTRSSSSTRHLPCI